MTISHPCNGPRLLESPREKEPVVDRIRPPRSPYVVPGRNFECYLHGKGTLQVWLGCGSWGGEDSGFSGRALGHHKDPGKGQGSQRRLEWLSAGFEGRRRFLGQEPWRAPPEAPVEEAEAPALPGGCRGNQPCPHPGLSLARPGVMLLPSQP